MPKRFLDDMNFRLLQYGILAFSMAGMLLCAGYYLKRGRLNLFMIVVLLVALGAAYVLVDMRLIEPNWIKIEHVEIHDPRLAPVLQGLKIVQITDLHTRAKLRYREEQLIQKVNALKPDLLFITGDFLNDISQLNATISLVKSLHASIGIFGVPGNSDYYHFDINGLVKELSLAGIDILRNESRVLQLPNGRVLRLAGVDDPVTGRAQLDKALRDVPPKEPVLLLAHSPDIFSKAVLANVDLVLVGHTHGAQVGIPFLVRRYRYADRYPVMQGIVRAGNTTMYINRGIGTTAYPIRFLCRPEIAVIEVHP